MEGTFVRLGAIKARRNKEDGRGSAAGAEGQRLALLCSEVLVLTLSSGNVEIYVRCLVEEHAARGRHRG